MKLLKNPSFAICAGIGCFIGWMTSLLYRGGVISGASLEGFLNFDSFFSVATFSATIVCVVLCLPPRKWLGRIGTTLVMGVFITLGVFCLAGTLVLGLFPVVNTFLCYLFGAVIGGSMAVFLVQWLLLLLDFDLRTTVMIFLIVIIIALIAFTITHYLGRLLGSSLLTTIFSMTLFLASLIFLFSARKFLHPIEAEKEEAPGTSNAVLLRITFFSLVVSFITQFLCMYTTVPIANAFSDEIKTNPSDADTYLGTELFGYLICGAIFLVLLFVFWKTARRPGLIVSVIYRIIAFALTIAFGLTLSLNAFPIVTYTVVLLTYFLMQVGIWLLALYASYLLGQNSVNFICYVLFAQLLGFFLGFTLNQVMTDYFLSSQSTVTITLLVLLGITNLTYLFVFNERDVDRVSKISFSESYDDQELAIDEKCRIVQKQYALTARETEVFKLLACGRNAVSIQELLHISYNTVKAHKHSLYNKLGIHSQQELLNLIEGVS